MSGVYLLKCTHIQFNVFGIFHFCLKNFITKIQIALHCNTYMLSYVQQKKNNNDFDEDNIRQQQQQQQ